LRTLRFLQGAAIQAALQNIKQVKKQKTGLFLQIIFEEMI
jgi:hypothetical protein